MLAFPRSRSLHFATLAALATCSIVQPARADERVTLNEVTLRKLPGENQDPVATYAAGVKVEVLEVKGRWVRIKIDKATGWVPRTKLSEPTVAPDGPAPPADAGPRSRKLAVVVSRADVVLRARPEADAPVLAPAAVGASLTVLDGAAGGWLHVDDGAGHAGWVPAGAVRDPGAATPTEAPPVVAPRRPRRDAATWTLHGSAALGYRSIDQRFTSNAVGGLANYAVNADASAIDAELVAMPPLGTLRLGGEAAIRYTASDPGIDYPGPTLEPGSIPFTMFEARAVARVGYHVGPVTPQLRLGGAYGAFLADEVANAGRMPREALWAATLGVGVEVAPLRAPVVIEARFDQALISRRQQTDGLADGMSSSTGGQWLDVRLAYAVGRHLVVFAGFAYERHATDWSGASERWAGVTEAHRLDHAQLVSFGVGAGR